LFATQVFYGDAGGNMSGHAEGGDDRFTGSGGAIMSKTFYGDAGGDISGFAKGGNDTFINEGGSTVSFYGDAGATMSGHAQGGNDLATLLGTKNFAVGDAVTMLDATSGGNDSLSGGDSSVTDVVNQLYGDAQVMGGATQGGDDLIFGGHAVDSGRVDNFLWGDAAQISGRAKGGSDVLYAGTAGQGCTVSNEMWGDGELSGNAHGGSDTFVFKDNGLMTVGANNLIQDFSQCQDDRIAFIDVAGVHSFGDLVITQSGTSTIIMAGADQVTLANFTDLMTANDFLFV
jgi:hypothetical protein